MTTIAFGGSARAAPCRTQQEIAKNKMLFNVIFFIRTCIKVIQYCKQIFIAQPGGFVNP